MQSNRYVWAGLHLVFNECWRRMWVSVLSSVVLPVFSTGKEGTSGSAIDLNIIDRKNTLVLRIESSSTRQRIHIGKWNKSLKIYLHLEI